MSEKLLAALITALARLLIKALEREALRQGAHSRVGEALSEHESVMKTEGLSVEEKNQRLIDSARKLVRS